MKIQQILFIFLFLCCLAISLKAQACGRSHNYFQLIDNNQNIIENAVFELFAEDKEEEDHLKSGYTRYVWVEQENEYLVSHGMCGQHSKVGLRISAKGFHTFEQLIDLSFGVHRYKVMLKRENTKEKELFQKVNLK